MAGGCLRGELWKRLAGPCRATAVYVPMLSGGGGGGLRTPGAAGAMVARLQPAGILQTTELMQQSAATTAGGQWRRPRRLGFLDGCRALGTAAVLEKAGAAATAEKAEGAAVTVW